MNADHTRTPSMDPGLTTPEHERDVELSAKELFAHGLLQAHYRETDADAERRVARLLRAIEGEDRGRGVWHEPAREMNFASHAAKGSRWRSLRFATGLAAAMTLVAVLAIEFTPTNSAIAAVQASVEASRSAGDRRYNVSVRPHKDKGDEPIKIGTLDVRDPEHVVIQASSPQGHRVTVGRSPEGVWAIRPDGTIDRFAPKSAMPRWVNFGSNTIVLESVDDLLTPLAKDYTLSRVEGEVLTGGNGAKLDRITAKIKAGHLGPEPERVEIWMDATSRVVRRLELHWPEFAARGEVEDAHDRRGLPEGGPARPHRGAMGGPRDDGGLPPGPARDEGGDVPPSPGPDGMPGPGPRDGNRPDPEHRPRRGPWMEGPRGFRPHPREMGRGLMGGPPEFLGERPDFRRGGPGGPPPPPRVMIFELEDGAVFTDGWFEPEAHGG